MAKKKKTSLNAQNAPSRPQKLLTVTVSTPLLVADTRPSIMTTIECIYVNPIMVPELLSNLKWLQAQTDLPILRYSIITSIHAPLHKAWIIDDEAKRHYINFYSGDENDDDEQ